MPVTSVAKRQNVAAFDMGGLGSTQGRFLVTNDIDLSALPWINKPRSSVIQINNASLLKKELQCNTKSYLCRKSLQKYKRSKSLDSAYRLEC